LCRLTYANGKRNANTNIESKPRSLVKLMVVLNTMSVLTYAGADAPAAGHLTDRK